MYAPTTDWSTLRERYRESLGSYAAGMRLTLAALAAGAADRAQLESLRRNLHKLHGSAATYGFPQVSDAAGRLETLVSRWVAEERAPSPAEVQAFREALETFDTQARDDDSGETRAAPADAFRILVVDDDRALLAAVQEIAAGRGWGLEGFESPEEALERHGTAPFHLVTLGGSRIRSEGYSWVREFRSSTPSVPIVVITTNGTSDRLAAAGAGADRVLDRRTGINALGVQWDELLGAGRALPGHVLVLDDDPAFQKLTAVVLGGAGHEVEALDDPRCLFDRAPADRPDLLLLDLELPTMNGLEVLRALRNAPEWADVSLIVVTGYSDPERRLAAYEAGADAVLAKPVRAHELRARVAAGLRRARRGRRPHPARRGGRRGVPEVYIVEDDVALLEMLDYALTNNGFRCATFQNGRDALDVLLTAETHGTRPVVLLDVDLPGLDGFSTLQLVERSRPGEYQIAIITVHASEREQIKAFRSGAVDYLLKPVSIPVVVAKVEQLLGTRAIG